MVDIMGIKAAVLLKILSQLRLEFELASCRLLYKDSTVLYLISGRTEKLLPITMPQALHLFSARMTVNLRVLYIVVSFLVSTSNQVPIEPLYQLIFMAESTYTEVTGSITMVCRTKATAEELPLNEVHFWLNRTCACDPSLRERPDIRVIKVNDYKIRFNLTRSREGYYTCGKRVSVNHVMESSRKTLISKY